MKLQQLHEAKYARGSAPKYYMYGDEDFEIVTAVIPSDILISFLEAAAKDDRKVRDEIVTKMRNQVARRVLYYSLMEHPDILKRYIKAVKSGKSFGAGETEYVAGFGPTKPLAKQEWQNMQTPEDDEDWDDEDWD